MQPDLQPIGVTGLVIVAGLQVCLAVLSMALGLGLGRQLLVAVLRMAVQLALVGQVLTWVFALDRAPVIVALSLAMCGVAAHAAVRRSERRFPGALLGTGLALAVSTAASLLFATTTVLALDRPWQGRYLIPLLGMLLGNSLTGVSLCLRSLVSSFREGRAAIEMALCLGATGWEASREAVSGALRVALIPTLNTMAVAGVVSLPGMMTGQILAGVDPALAVRYQAMIFLLIALCTATACGLVAVFVLRYHVTREHRLRELASD